MYDDDEFWSELGKWIPRLIVVGVILTAIILGFAGTFGVWANQINNELFNSSQQHIQAVTEQFSRDCVQIAQAKDRQTVLALENDIYSLSSSVDVNSLQMPQVTRTCVNKAINDVSSGK